VAVGGQEEPRAVQPGGVPHAGPELDLVVALVAEMGTEAGHRACDSVALVIGGWGTCDLDRFRKR